MQQWTISILVLAWKMAMAGAQCPSGFNCSGTLECYLIYPSEDGWKYTDPNGNIDDGDVSVYTSPNCYQFIRVTEGIMGSCSDAQRECEKVGGNITVINSKDEYDQLVNNVLYIVESGTDITFNVHVQNSQRDDIQNGCAQMTIEDGAIINSNDIENSDCSTTRMVNTIVCEDTDVNMEICPVPTTSMPTSSTKRTAKTPVTQTRRWSTVEQSLVTDETTAEYTSIVFTHPSKENQSEMEAWMVAVVASIVVITIIIILLSFLFIRRRQKRTKPGYSPGPNQHLPSIGLPVEDGIQDRATVSYSDGGVVVHEYYTAEDLLVVNDAYAVPYEDAAAKDGIQDQEYAYDMINAADMHSRSPEQNGLGGDEYAVPNKISKGHKEQDVGKADDTLNAADMHSRSPQQNGLGGHGYAVPNKNSKGRKEKDVDEAYDTLNAADMQPASEQHRELDNAPYVNVTIHGRSLQDEVEAYDSADMEPVSKQRRGEPSDAFDDEPYVNANARRLQDEDESYEFINAADMHSGYGGKENSGDTYDVPYKESTTSDIRDHGNIYNSLNGAEVHSKSGKHNVESGNEYGKLQNDANVPPKDNMYSYVTTEVGSGIVTMPHGQDQTYDKLQRNTELGGALTADHYYGSLQ